MDRKRFSDKGELARDFSDYRIIKCPKCSKPVDFWELKVSCIHCGYHKEFKKAEDGFKLASISVKLEDYLKISCCGEMLWALNLEHLDFLEKYVEADLRVRIPNKNKSVASRLPPWIKRANNREEILKSIQRLREKLSDAGYSSKRNTIQE
jgi:hypothetical protein